MVRLALYAYTTLYVTRIHEIVDGLAALRLPLILGLFCIALLFLAPSAHKGHVLQQAEVKGTLVLALLGIASLPLSVWPAGSLDFMLSTYSRVVTFYLFVTILVTTAAQLRGVVWAFILGATVLGLATALELKSMVGAWQSEYGGRAYASSTYDPNDVAMVMVCLIPYAGYGLLFVRRGLPRLLLLGSAAVALVAIVKTMSRGGFLGLAGVFIIILIRVWQSGRRQVAVALAFSVLGLSLAAPSSYWKIMGTILGSEGEGYLASGVAPRWEIWKVGLGLFLQNPVTGIGIGQFEMGYGLAHGGGGKWSAAHNAFVQIAVETGAVALVLYAWLLLRALRNAHFAMRADGPHDSTIRWIAYSTEASLVGYILCASALSTAYSPLAYLLLAVSLALKIQAQRVRADLPPTAVPAVALS